LQQVEELVVFLQTTAEDRTSVKKRVWLHIGETVRVGVVWVGLTDKLQFVGTKPYVRRVAMHNSEGARNVYLIGYNLGNKFVNSISNEAKQRGICEQCEVNEYHALVGNVLQKQTIARLSIPEGYGSSFLAKYPDMNEWPDLEEETVLSPIAEKEVMKPSFSTMPVNWDRKLHVEWSKKVSKKGLSMSGSSGAADAMMILGIDKLKQGKYKTVTKIIEASPYLSKRWSRDGNRIVRL